MDTSRNFMIKTAKLVKDLRAIGVETPARPQPPFNSLPADPTAADLELDRAYQSQCMEWIEAVAKLHSVHFPQST